MAMLGCRALSVAELCLLVEQAGAFYCRSVALRLQTMMIVAASTGLRIGELRTLRVGDVSRAGRAGSELYLQRRHAKGHASGRRLPLGESAVEYLQAWLDYSGLSAALDTAALFPPARGSWTHKPLYNLDRELDDRAARKNLDQLVSYCGLDGKVSWHSFRKFYAARLYELSGHDILLTKQGLGHHQLSSTLHYLDINEGTLYKLIRQVV